MRRKLIQSCYNSSGIRSNVISCTNNSSLLLIPLSAQALAESLRPTWSFPLISTSTITTLATTSATTATTTPVTSSSISATNCCVGNIRYFSKKKKQGQFNKKKNKKNRPRKPKNKGMEASKETPPLFLYQTASPTVYISAIAIDNSSQSHEIDDDGDDDNSDDNGDSDNEDHEMHDDDSPAIHPKSLFIETKPPLSFTNSKFEYISPKLFNHELPTNASIPEIAILGRSNVGKSSLINALTGTVNLARISKTPGRTQQVNYFGQFRIKDGGNGGSGGGGSSGDERDLVATPPLGYLIDLPGYGFAKAPDDLVNEWQKNTQDFIIARKEIGALQRLYMLIDSRRGLNVFDSTIMGWLDEAGIDYTVVLTKCDTVLKPMLVKAANGVCMRYHTQVNDNETSGEIVGYQGPFVHATSSRKNIGLVDLMYAIEADFFVGRAGAGDPRDGYGYGTSD